MDDSNQSEEIAKRLESIDALDAILPNAQRERLAVLLTDDDVATLKHLAKQGMGENSLRALASDLGYLQGWAEVAMDCELPWPAPESMLLKFIAHHLWDPEQKELDPKHGMPDEVSSRLQAMKLLARPGPHAPSTVKRRLSSWTTLHRYKGLEGEFSSSNVKNALRLAVRASNRPRGRKSEKAITLDILEKLIATCKSNFVHPNQAELLTHARDRALLFYAFAAGGRRRSEASNLRMEQITEDPPVLKNPDDPNSPLLPSLTIKLGRTKTQNADERHQVTIIGRPVVALKKWVQMSEIKEGAVFRSIDQWGNLGDRAVNPRTVNDIVKSRIEKAGLNPKEYSAHGLRAGYLTEAANQGIPLPQAMQQSGHRSFNQAANYYNNAEHKQSKAVRLLI